MSNPAKKPQGNAGHAPKPKRGSRPPEGPKNEIIKDYMPYHIKGKHESRPPEGPPNEIIKAHKIYRIKDKRGR